MKNYTKSIILFVLLTLLSGCTVVDFIKDLINNPPVITTPTPEPTIVPTPVVTANPTIVPTAKPTKVPTAVPTTTGPVNPVCGTATLPSKAHLLWKPVSDTSGNAVIVFDGKYKQEFSEVKVELKAGGTESAFWKGLELWGNPDNVGPRQHWRLTKKCSLYKDNALITAKDSKQTCTFRLEGKSCDRIE